MIDWKIKLIKNWKLSWRECYCFHRYAISSQQGNDEHGARTKLERSTERVLPVYMRPRQATGPQSTSVTILSSVMNNLLQWQLFETADGRRVRTRWNLVLASRKPNLQAEIVAKFRTVSSDSDKSNGRNLIDAEERNNSLAVNGVGECDDFVKEKETRCSCYLVYLVIGGMNF